jgi:hypothetical protein
VPRIFPALVVEYESDRLRASRLQPQLGAVHGDTRTNEVGEERELSTNEVLDFDPIPCIADQQVLIGGSASMRSEKRPMNSSGFLAAVWQAIVCTTLDMFLSR